MMNMLRFMSFFGKLVVVGILGMGLMIGMVSEARADDDNDSRRFEVVTMSCSAEDLDNRFLVEDVNATDQNTRQFLTGLRGLSCARALKGLLNDGYKIVPGGGGALAGDGADLVPHQIYTLTQKVKSDDDDDD